MFLIPARFVAYETVEMVNTVIQTLLALAAVLLILMVLAVVAVLQYRSSVRMVLQEQANLRQQEERRHKSVKTEGIFPAEVRNGAAYTGPGKPDRNGTHICHMTDRYAFPVCSCAVIT